MRKFLLMGCAAMAFVAVSAQEQSLLLPNVASTKSVVMKKGERAPMTVARFANANNVSSIKTIHEVSTPAKVFGKVEAKSIPSVYIEDYMYDDNIHLCDSVSMKAANAQDEDGNVYNLQATFSFNGCVQDVYGYYDSEKNTITFPQQKCYSYVNATTGVDYGDMYLVGYTNNDDNTATFSDLTFTIEEDGTLYCDVDGYAVAMSGDYEGSYWWVAEEPSFIPQNSTTVHMTSGNSGWETYESATATNDNTYSLDVYGVFQQYVGLGGYLSIDVNGSDLSMVTKQNVFPVVYTLGTIDEVYGDYLYIGGIYVDESARIIRRDADVTEVKGSVTEDGYVINNYYTLQSAEDSDGGAYTLWMYGLGIYPCETPMFTPGVVSTGINGVTITENKKNDNTIYNLAGQQVDKAYKGIVIKNGKKMIQK